MNITRVVQFAAPVFARMAIGTAFLSACADRFGLWGKAGDKGVAWGNFDSFLGYTASLNPYLSPALVPVVGWIVTIAEIVLGIMLIVGLKTRISAFLSGIMLLAFAIA